MYTCPCPIIDSPPRSVNYFLRITCDFMPVFLAYLRFPAYLRFLVYLRNGTYFAQNGRCDCFRVFLCLPVCRPVSGNPAQPAGLYSPGIMTCAAGMPSGRIPGQGSPPPFLCRSDIRTSCGGMPVNDSKRALPAPVPAARYLIMRSHAGQNPAKSAHKKRPLRRAPLQSISFRPAS